MVLLECSGCVNQKQYRRLFRTPLQSSIKYCELFNNIQKYYMTDSPFISSNEAQCSFFENSPPPQINPPVMLSQHNFNNSHLQNKLCVLSLLFDQNNRSFLELVQKCQALEKNLVVLKAQYNKQKTERLKIKQTIRKRLSQATMNLAVELEFKLFGIKDYPYSLLLAKPLPTQLYKQRNFDIEVILVDKDNNPIININSLPITLSAYTAADVPEVIFQNKMGMPVFKGICEGQLHQGRGGFEKLQFREVSSIFSKKWIYFVVYPKPSPFRNQEQLKSQFINHTEIRPLIVSEVVIKSKKK